MNVALSMAAHVETVARISSRSGSRTRRWRIGWWRPGVIDRYLLRHMLRWQAMIVAIVLALLSLEMLPRLLAELSRSDGGAVLVTDMLASLLPEYVAVALPIAVFLGAALTFRHLALHNEIDALAAAGLSDWRLLRWPLIVGLGSALLLFGIRGYLEPAGERHLDGIVAAIADGDYGVGLKPGIVHRLGDATLYFETAAPRGGDVTHILVQRGSRTVSAAAARLAWSGKGDLLISFRRGDTVSPDDRGRLHLLRFRSFDLAIPVAFPPPPLQQRSPRQQLDRYSLTALLTTARTTTDKAAAWTATAAIGERSSAASLCLLLPLFAPFLAIPPKRSRSAIGIGLGLLLIMLFWRLSALIEDTWPQHMPAADMLLLAAYTLAGAALLVTRQPSGVSMIILSRPRAPRRPGACRKFPIGPSCRARGGAIFSGPIPPEPPIGRIGDQDALNVLLRRQAAAGRTACRGRDAPA